jgi:hypothetical protein
MLVELRPDARCTDALTIVRVHGKLVAAELGLYVVPVEAAARILPGLQAWGALRFASPDLPAGTVSVDGFSDPLVPTEWWRAAVGVDVLTPPPAGRPVTIVDSGLDVSHPEFTGRVNTVALNPQEPPGQGDRHGTSVASVIAAPENGVGLVGIYPEAVLRSWDAADEHGTDLVTSEVVEGILAGARDGPGVVNLSFVSAVQNLAISQAVWEAVAKGSLVVAASGNDGARLNPPRFPADTTHVLTVGASDASNAVAWFSGRSPYVDLVAPGVGIPVALDGGWTTEDGTSFSTPLVSGASAWVWTARPELDASQLFEVMRRSAVDIGDPGRDDAAGWGLLNVPAALAYPAPVRDPLEPNDDIEFVRPGGVFDNAIPPLTMPTRRTATVQARIDRFEDPSDVYRVWLPKDRRVTATVTADANVNLGLWRKGTASITEPFADHDRLARSTKPASSKQLTFLNRGAGRFAYLAVVFPSHVDEATYRLRVS